MRLRLVQKDKMVTFETTLLVSGETVEKVGKPANFDTLKDIARISNGAFHDVSKMGEVVSLIEQLPEDKPRELRLRIWNQWWWGAIIVALAGLYWVTRKKMGLV